MPPPGRSSASSRSSAIASPKRRKRPPLQVPIAARPGSFTTRPQPQSGTRTRPHRPPPSPNRGLGPVAPAVGPVGLGLAAVVLLRPDADLLRSGFSTAFGFGFFGA